MPDAWDFVDLMKDKYGLTLGQTIDFINEVEMRRASVDLVVALRKPLHEVLFNSRETEPGRSSSAVIKPADSVSQRESGE